MKCYQPEGENIIGWSNSTMAIDDDLGDYWTSSEIYIDLVRNTFWVNCLSDYQDTDIDLPRNWIPA